MASTALLRALIGFDFSSAWPLTGSPALADHLAEILGLLVDLTWSHVLPAVTSGTSQPFETRVREPVCPSLSKASLRSESHHSTLF
jgi:hypothetical protein